jgi:hypothetical protein
VCVQLDSVWLGSDTTLFSFTLLPALARLVSSRARALLDPSASSLLPPTLLGRLAYLCKTIVCTLLLIQLHFLPLLLRRSPSWLARLLSSISFESLLFSCSLLPLSCFVFGLRLASRLFGIIFFDLGDVETCVRDGLFTARSFWIDAAERASLILC